MSILHDYNVNFFLPVNYGRKCISSTNDSMSQFIGDHNKVVTINLLINNVNQVINGSVNHWVGENLGMQIAYVGQSDTKIYKDAQDWHTNNNIAPDFVLPTAHFKIIIEAWRDYLQVKK
jgi:hypothetical protein